MPLGSPTRHVMAIGDRLWGRKGNFRILQGKQVMENIGGFSRGNYRGQCDETRLGTEKQ